MAGTTTRSDVLAHVGIHENAVGYPIKKLLGRSLDARRLALEIALRLHEGLDGPRAAEVSAGPAPAES